MKHLQTIREALLYYADEANNNHNYKSLMKVDDTAKAKEALAKLDEYITNEENQKDPLKIILDKLNKLPP